ncbi:hypothetical protein ACS0TY_007225 [Phlomoides rotata]
MGMETRIVVQITEYGDTDTQQRSEEEICSNRGRRLKKNVREDGHASKQKKNLLLSRKAKKKEARAQWNNFLCDLVSEDEEEELLEGNVVFRESTGIESSGGDAEMIETLRKKKGAVEMKESKFEVVDDITCQSLWGEGNVGWVFKKSEGRSGGIISLWDADKFSCLSSWDMNGALVVNGLWSRDGSACCIVNVYATNGIERDGRRNGSSSRDMMEFDSFIRNSGLMDLPLHGRSFTWYRPDGSCKSRLDRIMINSE